MPKNPGNVMSNWLGGCNSLLPPDKILRGQYSWLINGVNRGGIVQTRPGWDFIASLKGENCQGGIIFRPDNSRSIMLIAVDGLIYSAQEPFTDFMQIAGIQFSKIAPIITFQQVLKNVKLNADGTLMILKVPVQMVVIQDGENRAATYDGNVAVVQKSETPFFGVPIGLWMAWTSSRLWVFNGSRGYVSDLASPDTFSENTYLAERSNFELPAKVTGVIPTADEKALLVFTSTTTTAFQSNILDRAQWGLTPQFQQVIFPSIGCVSGRSPVNQYGLTWWFSRAGLVNLNAASYTLHNSQMFTLDGEMRRSARLFSPNQGTIAGAFFENYLLYSVPAGSRYNEHTWIADQSPVGQADQGAPMCWVGIWTGARPVQWMKTEIGGRERIFFVAFDSIFREHSQIHIWEAFKDDRRDNDGRIFAQMESAMIIAPELQRFLYAEIELTEILDIVDLTIYVGGKKGPWYKVSETTFQAQSGSIGGPHQLILEKSTLLLAYKPQSREYKTEEFSSQDRGCAGVESSDAPGKDKGFQLLLVWKGRMGVKSIKMVMEEDASTDSGACIPAESDEVNILTDTGESIAV